MENGCPSWRAMGIEPRPAQTYMRLAGRIRSASHLGPSIRATLRSLPKLKSVEAELQDAIAYAMSVWRATRDVLPPGSEEHARCVQSMPDGPFSTVAWLDFAAAMAEAESEADYRAAGASPPWREDSRLRT